MSTTGAPSSPDDTPKERLTRYLYIGKEYPVYHPGDWFVHDYYTANNVPSIQELAQDSDNSLVPIEIIKQVLEQGDYVRNLETMIFALAMCARQSENKKLREAAYNNVPLICKETRHFILFIKFCNQLNKEKAEPKTGNGHGWRNAVEKWYNARKPLELAKCVTQCKGRYGWKHKDIIKLAHYCSKDPGVEFIVKYLLYGLAKAKEAMPQPPEDIKEIVTYVETIERFKHCDDQVEAGRLVEMYHLVLDHVPAHLLKSEEVWNSLVQTMNLTTLLENIQRIHNLGFFKSDTPILAKVIDALSSKDKIIEDKVQPALVYITVKNYEHSGRPLSYEQRKAKLNSKKPSSPPNKPNPDLVSTLYKTLDLSSVNTKPTGLRFVVVVNMNKMSMESPCWHNGNVKVFEALAALGYSLRYEENLTFVTYKGWGGHTEIINKSHTFEEVLQKMEKLPVSNVGCDKPMNWAIAQNKQIDVFINVVDQAGVKLAKAEDGIKYYRKKMNLPNAKLVNCAMCASSTNLKDKYDKNILNTCGFDANLPRVIEAFSKSLF